MLKRFSFILVLFLISFSLPQKIISKNQYALNLTSPQVEVLLNAYIIEYQNKKCHVRPGYDPDTCKDYCRVYYEYTPTLPFKNAQLFDPQTGQCEPKQFCPSEIGVHYDEEKEGCFNFFTGTPADPIDAPIPTYSPSELSEVTFICQHGSVKQFKGILDCACDLGYTSYPVSSWGSKLKIKKCNSPVPFALYLPNFLRVAYNPSYDNIFPSPVNPNYWRIVLFYYIRVLKYKVTTFFMPWEVELVLFIIPKENAIRPTDWFYIWWGIFLIILIFMLTCCRSQELPADPE